jgi:hypothetical protein
MAKIHKTSKGTELPLLNLRGKDYLEVKYRLVWFREEHPHWSIETEFVSVTDKSACAKATVRDDAGRVIATSHKFENERGFPDFLEKAETGAIGRALALIGYGTQFCADELDEGDRIVDSPVTSRPAGSGVSSPAVPGVIGAQSESVPLSGGSERDDEGPGLKRGDMPVDPGEFQVPFGKKYKGKKVSEIPQQEIEGYLSWLEAEAAKKRAPLSFEVRLLKKAVELYHGTGDSKGQVEAG